MFFSSRASTQHLHIIYIDICNICLLYTSNTHFEKSQYTSRSYPFSEDTLKEKIREYLKHNRSINRKVLEAEFHIRKQTALNWLKKLEKSGFLIKEGSRNAPVYFLAEE